MAGICRAVPAGVLEAGRDFVDNQYSMSALGGPISAGLAGAPGAQQVQGQVQAKRERKQAESTRRIEDALDLKVAGVELTEAVQATGEEEPSNNNSNERNPQTESPLNTEHDSDQPGKQIDLTG